MPYSAPKTDWISIDPVANTDLNRIEGNIKAIKDETLEISGDKTFPGNNTHSGNDVISGTKVHNSVLKGTITHDGATIAGTTIKTANEADSGDNVYTGNNNFLGATVQLPGSVAGIIPIGGIIIWSGAIGAIPTNWHLCDGGAATPDLRGRFVIGAGGSYDPGNEEGAPTHDHNGSTGGHAITPAQMASHYHGITDPGHGHGITDPGHSHVFHMQNTVSNGSDSPRGGDTSSGTSASDTTNSATTGIAINADTTGVFVHNAGGDAAHSHSIANDTVLPPYYALAYIQRVS